MFYTKILKEKSVNNCNLNWHDFKYKTKMCKFYCRLAKPYFYKK